MLAGPALERPIELANVLQVGLRTRPHEPALHSLERTWSWQELDQAATRLAGHYLALGLSPGDRVASLNVLCSPASAALMNPFQNSIVLKSK